MNSEMRQTIELAINDFFNKLEEPDVQGGHIEITFLGDMGKFDMEMKRTKCKDCMETLRKKSPSYYGDNISK